MTRRPATIWLLHRMHLSVLTASLVLLLAASTAAAKPAPTGGPPQLVDLTPAFAAAWARTAALPDAERVAGVEAEFAPLLPGFYDAARFGGAGAPGAERYRARLLRRLKAFPEERAGIEEVSARFSDMFGPALTSFEARFGPMRGYPPIYLVHSLGEFDGGTRELKPGVRLMFGADVIARIHADHDVRPFFHHELFHLYHQRSFPPCEVVWCSLWTEGLAVYVAARLNPGASDAELLLTQPEPIRPAVEKDRAAAVCAVATRLNSTDDKDLGALFSSGRLGPSLPPRFGYYVGLLVAQDLGRTRSLDELARLSQAQARPLVEAALARLADCRGRSAGVGLTSLIPTEAVPVNGVKGAGGRRRGGRYRIGADLNIKYLRIDGVA